MSKTCGALGCTGDAAVIAEIPGKGERTVCQEHAQGYEVIGFA